VLNAVSLKAPVLVLALKAVSEALSKPLITAKANQSHVKVSSSLQEITVGGESRQTRKPPLCFVFFKQQVGDKVPDTEWQGGGHAFLNTSRRYPEGKPKCPALTYLTRGCAPQWNQPECLPQNTARPQPLR
jgi:hypothetical protein